MAEENQQETQPVFTIQKIYVRDLSVEVPNAPAIFLERDQPKVEFQLANRGEQVDATGHYEVVLTITVTAKLGERTVFLVEVHQAGIFQILNLPADSMEPVLGITCPNILFPYAREAVSDATLRAGFQPFLLPPVNFEMIYQQKLAQDEAAKAASH